jgi:hypothetical protein
MTAAAVGVLAAAGMCGSNVNMQLQGTSMWQMRKTGELTPFQCPWCGRWHGLQFVWPVKQIGAAMSAATHAHPFLCKCKSSSAGSKRCTGVARPT